MLPNTLNDILSPKSIAIIGASANESKRGNIAIRHLLTNHYQGSIYPINPKAESILDLPCYKSLEELPSTPDLVLVCTPAQTLPGIIQDCGTRGIRGAVVLATGFSETGEEGLKLEQEMVTAARQCGLRIIGPNTSGMFNAHCGANLVGYKDLKAGGIGLLSQSGNMALSLVTESKFHDTLGFSTYIGVGNEADVQFHEYLGYFAEDPHTQVIVGYIEGLKNGRDFLDTAAQVSRKKPIVLYKSGRTQVGQQSAKSHTGALAGSYDQAKGLMRQSGVTLVDRADEILPVAETLAKLQPYMPMAGRRVAILADGGGHATIAADALDELGISLPNLEPETQAGLAQILPKGAPVCNPVDVAGGTDSNPELFADCADLILQDSQVDALLVVGLFGGYAIRFAESLGPLEDSCASRLIQTSATRGKPILLQSLYKPLATPALVKLHQSNIPVFESIDLATHCLAACCHYSEAQNRLSAANPRTPQIKQRKVEQLISSALQQQRYCLYEHEALEALAAYGADTPSPSLVRSQEDLNRAKLSHHANRMVMKLVSQDILHKTDAGGVMLDLELYQLEEAFEQIVSNAKAYQQDARIEGVLVADMAAPGTEVIIGVTRDPQYGPVMMFGLGGIFVEVFKDVAFRALPLSPKDAEDMIRELRCQDILNGARGQSAVNREKLVELMLSVSDLCTQHPEISELDLNPIRLNEIGYNLLDARILLQPNPEYP